MKDKINSIFTITLVLSPILSLYGINISTITFLDVALFILLVIIFIMDYKEYRIRKESVYSELMPFFLFVFISYLMISLVEYNNLQVVDVGLRTIRYLFYLFVVIFFVKEHFKIELGIKVFKYFVLFATLFYFTQLFLMRYFGFYLKGYLPFLYVMRENLISFSENARYTEYFRARSIFGEISQYSISLSVYLVVSLFGNNNKKDRVVQLIITLGLLFSVSSLGVISAIVIWFFWIIKSVLKTRIRLSTSRIVFIMLMILLITSFLMNNPMFDKFYMRLGSSTNNRFQGYDTIINIIKDFSFLKISFGAGMDLQYFEVWQPSFTKFVIYFGLLGSLLYILSFIVTFMRMERFSMQWVLLGYFIALGVGTEVLVGNLLLLIYPFIITNIKKITSTGELI